MDNQFFCKNKDRAKEVLKSSTINGIDYLEVVTGDQLTLNLFFIHDLPGQPGGIPSAAALTKENIFIEGGVRVKGILVKGVSTSNNILTITVSHTGDFSIYTLKIGRSSTDKDNPPPGFDQQLSHIEFSFKINCPNDFDCKTENECQPEVAEEPSINYLAKDYASFKQLMLDRLSIIMPEWKERHAADLQITLVEMLAYVGDHLSYYQDAVATEAYLHTARRRISLKRHARLLDYFVHDGCNARAWVQVQVEVGGGAHGKTLDPGTVLMTNGEEGKTMLPSSDKTRFINERQPLVFETMHALKLNSAHNIISFYTWGDSDCCLPKGATRATLFDSMLFSPPLASPLSPPVSQQLSLEKGDVLVFEELYNPSNGLHADADPGKRHAVRIKNIEKGLFDELTGASIVNIEWYEEDALPFTLCLTSPAENIYLGEDERPPYGNNEKTVARGNIVLADHGETRTKKADDGELYPSQAAGDEEYYPRLNTSNATVAVKYSNETAVLDAAKAAVEQDAHEALPVVFLNDKTSGDVWEPQQDLLGSDRFATEFVVETEQNGTSYLRFGDDIQGKQPAGGFAPDVTFRTGNGKSGNVGADTINTIEWNNSGIKKIRNPLAARGGTDAETMEEVRQFAPQAFRVQERAVTADDYVEKTELHPEVQKAAVRFYWTGSWYTVFIIIDRKGGAAIDEDFKEEIRLHLEQYRMAGYDLEIRQPEYIPLQLVLKICVKEGYLRAEVKKSLVKVFGTGTLSNGQPAFFNPDNFTFGQPVYLSAIYKAVMEVAGVASAEATTFKRWTKAQGNELRDGLIAPGELEIIRLDNDPNFPENGKIDFIMSGGL